MANKSSADGVIGLTNFANVEQKSLFFEHLIKHLPCYVYWKDKNFVYQGCNMLTAELLGLPSPDTIVGMTDYDLGWEKGIADFNRKVDEEVIQSAKPINNIEETATTRDGHTLYLLGNKVPIIDPNGNVVGILGISTDNTSKVVAERKAQKLFDHLLIHLPCIVYWKDKNFVYQGCNQFSAELLGLSSADMIIGKTDYNLGWGKEIADFNRKIDEEIIRTGKPRQNIEEIGKTKDGRIIHLLGNKVPILDNDGHAIGILGISTDYTAIVEAEQKNSKSQRQ